MSKKLSFSKRISRSLLLQKAAIQEMVGRTTQAEETYKQVRAKFGLYQNISTFDVSRTSYSLARAIFYANLYTDRKTGKEYGSEYLLGAPFGKPIVNIAAGFTVGAPIQIIENKTTTDAKKVTVSNSEEKENPTIANVNQWLEEQQNTLFTIVRNHFRDGDTFVVVEDDGSTVEVPPEDVDIITDSFFPDTVIGYDIYTTIKDPNNPNASINYVDEIRTTYRRRVTQDESGVRTLVPGTLVDYRSEVDGGLEERQLPVVHFANEKEARALYGVSEYQSLYYLMANYHAVLAAAIKGNIYNSNATPVIQGVKNMKQFLDNNFTKDVDGNYRLQWDRNKMLVIGEGGSMNMVQSDGTAADAQTLLEVLFWLIAQNSETPEFAFGTAVQSSKASVSEQTPMLIKKSIRKQGQLKEPLTQLIDLYIDRMSKINPTEFIAGTQFTIDMPDILDKDLNVNLQIVNTLLEKGIITEETSMVMLNLGKYIKDFEAELEKAREQKEARNPIPIDIFGQPVVDKKTESKEKAKVSDTNKKNMLKNDKAIKEMIEKEGLQKFIEAYDGKLSKEELQKYVTIVEE